MDRLPKIPILASALMAALFVTGNLNAIPAGAEPAKPAPDPQVQSDSTEAPHGPSRVEIRGFVHDANGGPVRGATIRLMSETDTVRVSSDGSGRFHASLTAMRGVRVLVQAYGYRDLVRSYGATRSVIQAALALPPPYPLGWVTVTMAGDRGIHSGQDASPSGPTARCRIG
jgi:hypothetical protein